MLLWTESDMQIVRNGRQTDRWNSPTGVQEVRMMMGTAKVDGMFPTVPLPATSPKRRKQQHGKVWEENKSKDKSRENTI